MHFMLLIFVVLLCLVVWGFFHSDPQGVPRVMLLAFNAAVLGIALAVGIAVGVLLFKDAAVAKAGEKGLAAYLGIMAGGTAALLVTLAGGLVRNLLVFPLSKRKARPARP